MFRLLFFFFIASVSAKMDPFIVGGEEAPIKQWPFIAYMEVIPKSKYKWPIICGGSLISSQTVLTAGHCTDDVTDKKKNMRLFTFMIYMGHALPEQATVNREVLDYTGHESYFPRDPNIRNDIALMFLETPVTFSDTVKKTILVAPPSDLSDREELVVAGWGRINPHNDDTSRHLKMANIESISFQECRRLVPTRLLKDMVVCAGNSKDYAYSGDSGGPLVKRGNFHQVGIVSYRDETSGTTIYTSVAGYYNWIASTQSNMFLRFCNGTEK